MHRLRAVFILLGMLAAIFGCVGSPGALHEPRDAHRRGDTGTAGGAARLATPPGWHVERNRRNLCPRRAPVEGEADCLGLVWRRDHLLMAWYFHRDGWLGSGNATYRSAEPGSVGGFQCTYDRDGDLVTVGSRRGTYDFVRPEISLRGHRDHDVRPHRRWPSAYDDPDPTRIYDGKACAVATGPRP